MSSVTRAHSLPPHGEISAGVSIQFQIARNSVWLPGHGLLCSSYQYLHASGWHHVLVDNLRHVSASTEPHKVRVFQLVCALHDVLMAAVLARFL